MAIKIVSEADLDQSTDTASFNNARPFADRANDPSFVATLKPSFGQVWQAEARKNTITGSLIGYRGMTSEEQKAAEEDDRETLAKAGFWQGLGAGVAQPENIALIAGMVAAPQLAGPGMAARAGRVGYLAAEAVGKETVLHNVQETRTMDESVAYTLGSVLLGGVGAEAAGAGVRGLMARRAAAGTSVEADAARSFVNSVKPLQPKSNIPSPMVVDELLAGVDPKLAQSFKHPETAVLQAGDNATYHDGGAMQVRGTAISNVSDTPYADGGAMKLSRGDKASLSNFIDHAEKWATDRLTKGASSFNQRVQMQGGEEVKGYLWKMMPGYRITQQAADGTGAGVSVYSTRMQINQEMTTRVNRILNNTYEQARDEINAAEINVLAREIQERSGLRTAEGVAFGDEALAAARSLKEVARASGNRITQSLKDKVNQLITLTGRNGDESVIKALGQASGRLRREVMEPVIRRGAKYGLYDEGVLDATRETAVSYWPRRWDKTVIRNNQDAFLQDISPYITSESRGSWTATKDIMQKILGDEELKIVKTSGGLGIKVDGELVLDMIPDNVAARFLINDTDALMKGYVQAGSKEIAPAEVFKTGEWREAMKEHRKAASREYDEQVAMARESIPDGPMLDRALSVLTKDWKERETLMAYAETHALGNGPAQAPALRTAKQLTGVLHLGNRLMASLPDVAVHDLADAVKIVAYNFTKEVLFTATSGMKKALTGTGLSRSAQAQAIREQSETIGFVMDSAIYNRFEANLYENAAELEGNAISKSATFGSFMAKKAQDLQGATAWDAVHKEAIGVAIIQDTVKFFKGLYKPTEWEVADWGRHGFGTDAEKAVMFKSIQEQVEQHATKEHGGWFLNIDKWTNPEASTQYQAFLRNYTETKIVTANPASMPLGATGNGAMSFVSQYLSWSHGFIDRVYKPYMDYGKMEGVKYALKLQMATYAAEYMRGIANGKEPEDLTFATVGVRSIQQAQILPFSFAPLLNRGLEQAGWSLPEVLGQQDIRFSERAGVPVLSAMGTGGKMIKEAVTGNVSEKSIYSMEMMVPGLQASHMKWLARDIAEFTADEFGLPEKSKQIIKK